MKATQDNIGRNMMDIHKCDFKLEMIVKGYSHRVGLLEPREKVTNSGILGIICPCDFFQLFNFW